jgi:hypothetical protein
VEGLWKAEECPPGTYRSNIEADGNGCVSCPQGTWSKNWQLREKGECNRCPTGKPQCFTLLSIRCRLDAYYGVFR